MENEILISSAQPMIISKENARAFYEHIKVMIYEETYDPFKFLEVIKLFDKVNELIKGNSQASNPEEREGDKEFKNFIIDLIKQNNGKYVSPRGAKFEIMENAGTKYHYENCNDPILTELVLRMQTIEIELKARQDFLKTVPLSGLEIHVGEGELVTVYPPYKTSSVAYKITLPK